MDVTDIKSANVRKVLDTLRFSSGMTKRDIAAETNLSFSTVSNICNDLQNSDILYEVKSSGTSIGRTPDKFHFYSSKFCSICVELQQENLLRLSVLDFANNRLFQAQLAVTAADDAARWVEFIYETKEHLLGSPLFQNVEFAGVGISIPGIYDRESGRIVNNSYRNINNIQLADMVTAKTGLPCYIENEANLCAISMAQRHSGVKNILYLYSSAGLGIGIVCEGNLLRGKNGYAAELSHIPLGNPEIICPFCGMRGCIENDLAQRGMDVFHFPSLSDAERSTLLQDRGHKLGELLAILVNLFDPQTIYIGGSALENYPLLAPYVTDVLSRRCQLSYGRGLYIEHDLDSAKTIQNGINQIVYENWYPL